MMFIYLNNAYDRVILYIIKNLIQTNKWNNELNGCEAVLKEFYGGILKIGCLCRYE